MMTDLDQFFKALAEQQTQFIRSRFNEWMEEKDAAQQTERARIEAERARMWREVWAALEDAE